MRVDGTNLVPGTILYYCVGEILVIPERSRNNGDVDVRDLQSTKTKKNKNKKINKNIREGE